MDRVRKNLRKIPKKLLKKSQKLYWASRVRTIDQASRPFGPSVRTLDRVIWPKSPRFVRIVGRVYPILSGVLPLRTQSIHPSNPSDPSKEDKRRNSRLGVVVGMISGSNDRVLRPSYKTSLTDHLRRGSVVHAGNLINNWQII